MSKDNHKTTNNPTQADSVITGELQQQILKVRDTGEVNMFDVYGVQRIANNLGLFELVDFLANRKNWAAYSEFILHGKTIRTV